MADQSVKFLYETYSPSEVLRLGASSTGLNFPAQKHSQTMSRWSGQCGVGGIVFCAGSPFQDEDAIIALACDLGEIGA